MNPLKPRVVYEWSDKPRHKRRLLSNGVVETMAYPYPDRWLPTYVACGIAKEFATYLSQRETKP